jgi:hypothetical protein
MPATAAAVQTTPQTQRWLRWSGFLCASLSLAALVAHVLGWMAMPYFLEFFAVPAFLLLFALAAYARRVRAELFLNGLMVGTLGGLAATFVYDGARTLIHQTHLFGYSGFVPILMFGSWITGRPIESAAAAVAGWTYHYWNGISFGIMYALMLGRRHWLFGVGYGILMECCMLGLFPLFLRVSNKVDFIAVSMIGHLFYGAVLGVSVQRFGTR